jgi:2-haloalkanoic acid dehalogenase type II
VAEAVPRAGLRAGGYRPYESIVAEAAGAAGLPPGAVERLTVRWSELEPWPDVMPVLGELSGRVPMGTVTNCSEQLGRVAAGRVGVQLEPVVTAERAGAYKPRPEPYRLALRELGLQPHEVLFVAGSGYDLVGAGGVGMQVYWHDRRGLEAPPEAPEPLRVERSLLPLAEVVRGGG